MGTMKAVYRELGEVAPEAQKRLDNAFADSLAEFHKEDIVGDLYNLADLIAVCGYCSIEPAYELLVEMALSKKYVEVG